MSYARAFSKNKGRVKNISLEGLGVELNTELQQLHDNILKMRDQIYAHSDEEFAHVRLDVYKHTIRGETEFLFPHMQFEHGMEFHDYLDRSNASWLIGKVMYKLFPEVQRISGLYPDEMPIYLKSSRVLPDRSD